MSKKSMGLNCRMTLNKTCPHGYNPNTISCKYCGRPQCDLCRKEHEEQHVKNNDKELPHPSEEDPF